MNEQLRLLINLQKLDTSIIAFNSTIKDIPRKISIMEQPLKEAQTNIERKHKAFEAAEKKKRAHESKVEELTERIEKMKGRTNDIKDNKAYTAHLSEIEKAAEKRFKIEDEILDLMQLIDEEAANLKEAETALKEENTKADALKQELEAEVKEAGLKLKELKDQRSGIVDGIGEAQYDRYMDLLTSNAGLAVTLADNAICTGCSMSFMPQLFVELQKNDSIISCPQCNRIMYYEPPAE